MIREAVLKLILTMISLKNRYCQQDPVRDSGDYFVRCPPKICFFRRDIDLDHILMNREFFVFLYTIVVKSHKKISHGIF
jgi:hypothetical protein